MADLSEKELRKDDQKFSFSMSAWDMLAWAAVFATVDPIAKGVGFIASEGLAAATFTGFMAGLVPVLLFGAITLGVVYMGRQSESKRKELEDKFDTIKKETLEHTHGVELPVRSHDLAEYPQNERKDGKTWLETTTGKYISEGKEAVR